MSSITLTTGMRQNLLALQSTNVLQEMTQQRLATGKKVNSALDNPSNFFTALAHNNRANDLLSFKDGISEAIQTIKAADTAITGITKLIESAKAVAESAKSALAAGTGSASQTLTINAATSITAGTTISIGGTAFTAVAGTATTATTFSIDSGTTTGIAAALATAINAATETRPMSASVNGSALTVTATTAGATMGATDIEYSAALSLAYSESAVAATGDLTSKLAQYSTLMNQLDDLKSDAFYKGKNLLGGASTTANDMTVRFGNSHNLAVASFDGSRSGLALDATLTSTSEATLQASIDKLEAGLETLRTKSSDLSSNLAIVSARNEWITGIAETLQTGAANLTLADANEEGANMLMLQTRQSISTSALSMSAQAAQSVLRLFQ
ncbi:MAG: hypothetical protein C0399_00125 [Syntrophus sp. (in: bacteria)]|nr:hypothetical protein [Syntrophus sp. (in: bacteria)]